MIIRIVYSIFVGALLALFVGVGVSAFYPAPKTPSVGSGPAGYMPPEATMSAQQLNTQDEQWNQFNNKSNAYNTHVAIFVLACAVIYLVLSLTYLSRWPIFADGALYGGLMTLGYAIMRISMGNNTKYEFGFVAIALLIAIFIGDLKFIKPRQTTAPTV